MNNLQNIVVFIKDEAMLQEAREILIANGQKVHPIKFIVIPHLECFNLSLSNTGYWMIGFFRDKQQMTLPELEQLLKQNRNGTLQS